jgi:hypothetical protein
VPNRSFGVMIVSSISLPADTASSIRTAPCQLIGQKSGMRIKASLFDTTSPWWSLVVMPLNLVTMGMNALVVPPIASSFSSTQMAYTIQKFGSVNVPVLLLIQSSNSCHLDYFRQRSSNPGWHSHSEFSAKPIS